MTRLSSPKDTGDGAVFVQYEGAEKKVEMMKFKSLRV